MNLTILTNTSTKKEKLEKGSLLYVNSNGFSLSEKATNQLEITDGDRVIIAKDEESGAFFIGKGTETLGAKAKVKTAKAVFSSSAAHVELGGEKGKKSIYTISEDSSEFNNLPFYKLSFSETIISTRERKVKEGQNAEMEISEPSLVDANDFDVEDFGEL